LPALISRFRCDGVSWWRGREGRAIKDQDVDVQDKQNKIFGLHDNSLINNK
jgi:hypothetical protein